MRTSSDIIQQAHVLHAQKRFDEAALLCRKLLEREPYNVAALQLLGHIAHERGQFEEALAQFRKAANLQPGNPALVYGMTAALHALNRLEEAAQACSRVIQLRPDYANAYMNLGTLLSQMGMQQEAIVTFRRAIQLQPNDPYAHSNLLYALFFIDGIDPTELYQQHVAWAQRHAEPLGKSLTSPANDRSPDRPLRLGFVSGDLREHSVVYFLEPLLESFDRSRFHVTCYSATTHTDSFTVRLKTKIDTWRDIATIDDLEAARLVRDDRIDILIDLSGHSGNHRLLLFARRPAPVQITWLGYPGTTGMRAMDYRITDAIADPVGSTEAFGAEKLLRLPTCAWCYRPDDRAPQPDRIPGGPITFGSFNRVAKITPRMIELWSRILSAVPSSRLLIKSEGLHEPAAQKRFLTLFEKRHIAPDRIELLGRVASAAEHLALYNRIDIALDTFPYNGTTTTCEALWMGVPVVTLAGTAHVSRVGASLLTQVGLQDQVAASDDGYVRAATNLAADSHRLAELHQNLRQRMRAGPLMDSRRFAREFEAALRSAFSHAPAPADGSGG